MRLVAKQRSLRGSVHRWAIACLWTSLCLAAAPGVAHAQEQWQLGTTPSISRGTYGTDTRTDIVYTPFTARRLFTDGDLTFVMPYTCIRGSGDVTVVDGTPVRTDLGRHPRLPGIDGGQQSDGRLSDRTGRGGANSVPTPTTNDAAPIHETGGFVPEINTCGLGDVIVRGRYYVVDERGWAPTVAVRAHFKAPTASAEAGLGTGRPDEGVGLEVSRLIGGGFMAMVDGGYTLIGKPDGVDFNNRWWYDVGAAQSLAGGVANVSVFFEEYAAIVPGYANARDILTVLSLKSASGWRVQLLREFGLSDGAPDFGFTIGASRRF